MIGFGWPRRLVSTILVLLSFFTIDGYGMTDDAISALRQDTRNLFYHGYTNYLAHAFPEDELKPISCRPQTRSRDNPADIGMNDVLGNYSLTLIDSLSTLAILASDQESAHDDHNALQDFQRGVKAIVDLYGDGSNASCGSRACGFDLDSKVQVFETNIRGVGGLLSAHLFAIGELPIQGYDPEYTIDTEGGKSVQWDGFCYDGQLLRLAHDLAKRLLPAFSTATGLPYPRVNLRHGIPFYQDAEEGVCRLDGTSSDPREITETCASGAGSLVLEFTLLSRLVGDDEFEILAKKAFWAVYQRRSIIGLVGNGIDAESGEWTMPPLAGIGAGTDSFFEYALKSHIMLSSLPSHHMDDEIGGSNDFLEAWQDAHAAVKRHVFRDGLMEKHPYYGQNDLVSGAPRYSWIDNLSAYYPGLLTLAGELEEAIRSHLLYSALWTRYAALPERWHVSNAFIDPNFKHWAGRPEFIESSYWLYQATKDPYYLHVGEMTLRDIRRRCWTRCGWADLGDVVSGEQRDRMESFFLGETAKYLYLLFDKDHPLNRMDAAVVFTTEGHPLVVPQALRKASARKPPTATTKAAQDGRPHAAAPICPVPQSPLPLTVSNVANREDLFHAAALANLHLVPLNPSRESALLEASKGSPGISLADIRSPTNYTFYPWTLPSSLIPAKGSSKPMRNPVISTLTFPNLGSDDGKITIPPGAVQKILDGIIINSLSNIRLNMVEQPRSQQYEGRDGVLVELETGSEYRVHGIANWALGRDEKVLLSDSALHGVSPSDPHFTKIKDLEMVDLVLDVYTPEPHVKVVIDDIESYTIDRTRENHSADGLWSELETMLTRLLTGTPAETVKQAKPSNPSTINAPTLARHIIPAILPTGVGAAPLPSDVDNIIAGTTGLGGLPLRSIFFLDSTLCRHTLPVSIAKTTQVLILNRGDCSFNEKLANIPAFPPSLESLQLVIVLSLPHAKGEQEIDGSGTNSDGLIRPLLDLVQLTPNGFERRNPIGMVMIDGTDAVVDLCRRAASRIGKFDGNGKMKELRKAASSDSADSAAPSLGVKRRYWFESMGIPIGNLLML